MKKLYLLAIVVAGSFLTLECSKPAGAGHQRKKSTLTQEQVAMLKKMLGGDTVDLFQDTKTESYEQKTAREKMDANDSLSKHMAQAAQQQAQMKARATVKPKAVSACAQVAAIAAKA